jgi:AcrR family transcriptional regulator
MPRGTTNGESDTASGGPRRSGLLQERSRNTRQQLVRTALALWNERGFERGIEETTVEEIARAAGVTKGTFYFHFAHKEDILLEMGWAAVEAMIKEADAAMRRGRPAAELVETVLTSLVRRIARTPRPAVLRSAAEFSRRAHDVPTRPEGTPGFKDAFAAVVTYAVERGDLPAAVDVDDISLLLQAATMDALRRWAESTASPAALRQQLHQRAEVILSGASVVYGWRPSRVAARAT